MHIKSLKTHDEIAQSFDAFCELRPHLTDKEVFVAQVMQQQKDSCNAILPIGSNLLAKFLLTEPTKRDALAACSANARARVYGAR